MYSLPNAELMHTLTNSVECVRVCRFSPVPLPNGAFRLATGGDDGRVLFWNVTAPSFRNRNVPLTELQVDKEVVGKIKNVWVGDLCWTEDGNMLAISSDTVRVWVDGDNPQLATFHVRGSFVKHARITPSGSRLVTIDGNGTLYLLQKVVPTTEVS